jgi:hypothetical protein
MMVYFNAMSQQEETKQIQEQSVKVFYMNHYDGLSRLTPLLLLEGEKIWQGAIKQRINGNPMYYIFFNSTAYIKLWKDGKGSLLFDISNYEGSLFFNREPQVWYIDILLNELKLDDDSLTYNDVTLKFNMPIFALIRKLNEWLDVPVASIIHKLFF